MIPFSEEEYYHHLDNLVLESCHQIRKVFINRWKAETGENWIDDKEHIQQFLKGYGKVVLKKAKTFQKRELNNNCLAEWDVQLLSLILQNFGEKEKYKEENDAVHHLKQMRNDLAHHKTKKISKGEYDKILPNFKSCMKSLGMEDKSIENMVQAMSNTSSLKAADSMKKLHEKANKYLEGGEFGKAIECFSEAVEMPTLLQVDRGIAFEKRAECYLSSVKELGTDDNKCDRALLDAKMAVELNECSWKAHYLAAKCFQWKGNFSDATSHYERSLALSPGQKQVARDYDYCNQYSGESESRRHLTPESLPVSVHEHVDHLKKAMGIKMDKDRFCFSIRNAHEEVKGQKEMSEGLMFFHGWGVSQDFVKAAKCFAKSAAMNNAEGTFYLGFCYYKGSGVDRDITEALKRFRDAAAMDKHTGGNTTSLKCNVGVANAEDLIGRAYLDGIGVEQDYKEAVKWFQRGMEHGQGNAAYMLGFLHHVGHGLPKDEKMAEYYLREAVNLKCSDAPMLLVQLYLEQMEPEKAMHMVQISKEMETAHGFSDVDTKLFAKFDFVRSKLNESFVKFEKFHMLPTKGLTLMERYKRCANIVSPALGKELDMMTDDTRKIKRYIHSWGENFKKPEEQDVLAIGASAVQGSFTAFRVMATFCNLWRINKILASDKALTENQEREICNLLYQSACWDHDLLFLWDESKQPLKPIVSKWFQEKGENLGEDDMKLRFCFVVYNSQYLLLLNDVLGVEHLKEGIRRYPDNHNYYVYLSYMYGLMQMFEEGKSVAEQGLQKFPHQADLLYSRAAHMGNLLISAKQCKKCLTAYKLFLNLAPVHHRYIPAAYYQMAYLYAIKEQTTSEGDTLKSTKELFGSISDVPSFLNKVKDIEKVEYYFEKGKTAEQQQLPCHIPEKESDAKFFAKTFLTRNKSSILMYLRGQAGKYDTAVLERKKYLRSPTRKALVLEHRQRFGDTMDPPKWLVCSYATEIYLLASRLKQTTAKKMSGVEPILLVEMNPTKDRIYENRVLELTILDEPNTHICHPICILLVAEDDYGDVTRVAVYNVKANAENLAEFQPGCRIAIVNPYMRIMGANRIHVIRNDDPRCIVFLEKVNRMCRFCGAEKAPRKCSQCGRPYCSRQCQKLDWKMFQHKLICNWKSYMCNMNLSCFEHTG